MASAEFKHEVSDPLFSTILTAEYPVGTGVTFDLGGAVRVLEDPAFGLESIMLGASFSSSFRGHNGTIKAVIHSPFVTSGKLNFDGNTTLDRLEKGLHVHLIGSVGLSDRVRLWIYGGPSYFSISQDVITCLLYTSDAADE